MTTAKKSNSGSSQKSTTKFKDADGNPIPDDWFENESGDPKELRTFMSAESIEKLDRLIDAQLAGKPEMEDEGRDQVGEVEGLIISPSDLLPGDILLFHSLSPNVVAKQISKVTGSPYTHAAIYIGDGEIAESKPPFVKIRKLSSADTKGIRIGVLRSQMVFSHQRAAAVREFVQQLVAKHAAYDLTGALTFNGRNKEFHERLLDEIAANYGKVTTTDEFLKQAYFCSALVVACYTVTGVIGDTAQVAYQPNVISPGDLHRDPTFGWVLGYIVPAGENIPEDDPLKAGTLWKGNWEERWW